MDLNLLSRIIASVQDWCIWLMLRILMIWIRLFSTDQITNQGKHSQFCAQCVKIAEVKPSVVKKCCCWSWQLEVWTVARSIETYSSVKRGFSQEVSFAVSSLNDTVDWKLSCLASVVDKNSSKKAMKTVVKWCWYSSRDNELCWSKWIWWSVFY